MIESWIFLRTSIYQRINPFIIPSDPRPKIEPAPIQALIDRYSQKKNPTYGERFYMKLWTPRGCNQKRRRVYQYTVHTIFQTSHLVCLLYYRTPSIKFLDCTPLKVQNPCMNPTIEHSPHSFQFNKFKPARLENLVTTLISLSKNSASIIS